MAYFDTEELWFPEWEHGGTPWENPDGYAKHNPIDHVDELEDADARRSTAAATSASSTRRAWRRSPRCSARASRRKFLYFPDENHWVLKPQNSILWHETVLGWLDRWLKQPAGGTGSGSAP